MTRLEIRLLGVLIALSIFFGFTAWAAVGDNAGQVIATAELNAPSIVCSNPNPPGWCDVDGDGFSRANGDCADTNPAINPGAAEVCNGFDDNCNNQIDEGSDNDFDGVTTTCDCDDADPIRFPGAAEVCDNVDNNCDGVIDEGCDGLVEPTVIVPEETDATVDTDPEPLDINDSDIPIPPECEGLEGKPLFDCLEGAAQSRGLCSTGSGNASWLLALTVLGVRRRR